MNLIKMDTYHHSNGMQTSLVDHFLNTDKELYMQSGICPYKQSGHNIIFDSRKKFKSEQEKKPYRARKYKNLSEPELIGTEYYKLGTPI